MVVVSARPLAEAWVNQVQLLVLGQFHLAEGSPSIERCSGRMVMNVTDIRNILQGTYLVYLVLYNVAYLRPFCAERSRTMSHSRLFVQGYDPTHSSWSEAAIRSNTSLYSADSIKVILRFP